MKKSFLLISAVLTVGFFVTSCDSLFNSAGQNPVKNTTWVFDETEIENAVNPCIYTLSFTDTTVSLQVEDGENSELLFAEGSYNYMSEKVTGSLTVSRYNDDSPEGLPASSNGQTLTCNGIVEDTVITMSFTNKQDSNVNIIPFFKQ